MKKYINFLFAATLAAFTVLSCQPKEEAYEFGPKEDADCYGVYFPSQAASGSHIYNPTQDKSVDITLKRTNTKGAITVPITTEYSAEGVFTKSEASFADGQEETTFKVRFDNAEEGKTYTASFVIDDTKYSSIYNSGAIALDFSVMCVEMVTLKDESGKDAVVNFTINSSFLTDQGYKEALPLTKKGKIQYYEVDGIRYCKTVTDDGKGVWDNGKEIEFRMYTKLSFKVKEVDMMAIEVPFQSTGYSVAVEEGGPEFPVDAMDYYNYFTVANPQSALEGKTFADFVKSYSANYQLSYYDNHGGFYFYNIFNITGSGYWYGAPSNDILAIAEGYLRVDYSFNAETDYSVEGETPVYLKAGIDIARVKYAVYEGSLNAAQTQAKVTAIADSTEVFESFDAFELNEAQDAKYGTFYVSPEKTGDYTIVLVACDKDGKMQNSASCAFRFIAAADEEEYQVDMNLFTEDTPERYRELHKYDSFAYCMYGSELTDVHLGIFNLAKLSDPNAAFDAVKSDSKYAVSAEVLAEINAQGGYYDVLTTLAAKTTYLVIMWATNGNLDGFQYALYTTDKLPYVWNNLGIGVYTEDVISPLYGMNPVDVECNVYEEKNTPGLYMIDGFQKNYIAALLDPEEDGPVEDYEDILWRNCELVIDATDPESVFIELQDYGICLNPSEGFVDGVTSMYNGKPFSKGKLENGVISFPTEKGLLSLLDGEGYYYANQHGAFKVVLPSASTPAGIAKPKPTGFNVNVANKSLYAPKSDIRYERDPKPVKVAVKVVAPMRLHKTAEVEKAPVQMF